MKTLMLSLLFASAAFDATYQGKSIDGKKAAASTRINGAVVPVTVRFEGKGPEVWLKGEILSMKLAYEVIDDLAGVTVYDKTREFVLTVDLD